MQDRTAVAASFGPAPGRADPRPQVSLGALAGRRRAAGVVCDIQAAHPYKLAFANDTDVICLLFGAIEGRAAYDGGRSQRMRFEPLTIAWHPAGGHVAVDAEHVGAGFAALSYGHGFAERLVGDGAPRAKPGSLANIASPTVGNLVCYARALLCGPDAAEPMALEMLAGLAYLEAMRGLRLPAARRAPHALGARDIARAIELIESDLAGALSYEHIAGAIGVPVTTLARAFRRATGRSVHRYVLERRVARVCALLAEPMKLADIAQACGFSSQAHMTTMFARETGTTPGQYRLSLGLESVKREI